MNIKQKFRIVFYGLFILQLSFLLLAFYTVYYYYSSSKISAFLGAVTFLLFSYISQYLSIEYKKQFGKDVKASSDKDLMDYVNKQPRGIRRAIKRKLKIKK